MTSDRLRSLVKEATSEMNAAGQTMTEASGESWRRLITLAPQLAELVADMAEALRYIEWVWDGESANVCPACGKREDEGHDRSCSTAPALARQAALFPEDSA